jgi:hypothetical protein
MPGKVQQCAKVSNEKRFLSIEIVSQVVMANSGK